MSAARITVFLAFLMALVLPGSAAANHVQCGDTITQDTTLDSGVVCADDYDGGIPENAIIIGADNITLDLNGHIAKGSCQDFGAGVLNIGHRGVTIKNGQLGSWQNNPTVGYFGIRLVNADDNVLRDLTAPVCNNGPAIWLSHSNRTHISNVSATTYRGAGIGLSESNDNIIKNSTLSGNSTGIALAQSHGNRIRQNWLGNTTGISLFESDHNLLNENTVVGGADHRCKCALGIWFTRSNTNVVRRNTISGSVSGEGLLFQDSDDNRVAHNSLSDNGLPDPPWEVLARDGMLIDSASSGTEMRHNTVIRSGDDGIDVRNSATTLIANRANENGDFGIEAVPGVRGRGNRAFGNGNPLQCLNVECK